jgi:hypothetical protein
MNKHKRYLLMLGTYCPLTALASGIGDTLDWMGLHVFVVLAFIVFIILARVNLLRKGIIVVVFIAAEYLSAELTVGLPYSDKKLMLQVVSIAIPILATIASYWTLKAKFRRKGN